MLWRDFDLTSTTTSRAIATQFAQRFTSSKPISVRHSANRRKLARHRKAHHCRIWWAREMRSNYGEQKEDVMADFREPALSSRDRCALNLQDAVPRTACIYRTSLPPNSVAANARNLSEA